jgi:hypothetical protein
VIFHSYASLPEGSCAVAHGILFTDDIPGPPPELYGSQVLRCQVQNRVTTLG